MRVAPAGWLLLAALPALALASVHKHVDHADWTQDYDRLFRKYTKHYFGPHQDWRWFKAQAIAESGLDPDAKSPAGAVGIMQILPSTFEEIRRDNPYVVNITDPRWNIAAGIYYNRQLYRKWKNKKTLPTGERLYFAFASYNAGLGNVLRAYRRAEQEHGDVKAWLQVAPHAPGETRHYVRRIDGLMRVR
jgi:membrane-bound lytic murein transglycosylase F